MVDVVSNQTEITYCETTAGLSGDTFVLENQILVQGSNSVAVIQTANGINDVIFTGGPFNMTGKHLRMYMSSNIMPDTDTKINNGIQIFAGDGTNTAFWTVGGSDTYSGGWIDFFVDVDSIPTSGSVDSSAITSVGIRINTISKPRNATNSWYDNWRFGNDLICNSNAAEAISFKDIALDDGLTNNKYDILELIDDVIFAKGGIILGDSIGSKNCNFVSLNETVYFIDRIVSDLLYNISSVQNTGLTDIDIRGLTCKTVGVTGGELDFSTAINSFLIKGSSFSNKGTMTFPIGTLDTTKFISCGILNILDGLTANRLTVDLGKQINLNTAGKLEDSTISNSIDPISSKTTDLANFVRNSLISDGSTIAVEVTTLGSGSMTWDNSDTTGFDVGVAGSPITPTATGNELIFVNVASGTLNINVAAGSAPPSVQSAGAIINVIEGLNILTITGQIVGSELIIYDLDDADPQNLGTELKRIITATASETYSYSSAKAADDIIIVMIETNYKYLSKRITLSSSDSSIELEPESETN